MPSDAIASLWALPHIHTHRELSLSLLAPRAIACTHTRDSVCAYQRSKLCAHAREQESPETTESRMLEESQENSNKRENLKQSANLNSVCVARAAREKICTRLKRTKWATKIGKATFYFQYRFECRCQRLWCDPFCICFRHHFCYEWSREIYDKEWGGQYIVISKFAMNAERSEMKFDRTNRKWERQIFIYLRRTENFQTIRTIFLPIEILR